MEYELGTNFPRLTNVGKWIFANTGLRFYHHVLLSRSAIREEKNIRPGVWEGIPTYCNRQDNNGPDDPFVTQDGNDQPGRHVS
jgi:hypothetical protein